MEEFAWDSWPEDDDELWAEASVALAGEVMDQEPWPIEEEPIPPG